MAVAANGVIGKDNKLVWHLPDDMRYFMNTTKGHCVITGRKNYESIPEKFRPLKERTNIVVSHQTKYEAPGAIVVHSLQEAIEKAQSISDKEIFIIGGAQIYKQSLPLINRIYITEIKHTFEGDAFFPSIPPHNWKEVSRQEGMVDERNIYPHSFVLLERKE